MKTVEHDYDAIHSLVDSTPGAFWDGYTAVFFTPDRRGMRSGQQRPDGLRHVGRWGVAKRVDVETNGTWKVPANIVNLRQPRDRS